MFTCFKRKVNNNIKFTSLLAYTRTHNTQPRIDEQSSRRFLFFVLFGNFPNSPMILFFSLGLLMTKIMAFSWPENPEIFRPFIVKWKKKQFPTKICAVFTLVQEYCINYLLLRLGNWSQINCQCIILSWLIRTAINHSTAFEFYMHA